MSDINRTWSYPDEVGSNGSVVGSVVEATDGHIGKIDEASTDAGRSHMVVDTGWWIFGKKRLVPTGVSRIDQADHKVFVNMTKDEIKSAPDCEDEMRLDDTTRDPYDTYYGPFRL